MSIDSYKCRSTVISVDHITVEVKKKRGTFDGPNKPPYISKPLGNEALSSLAIAQSNNELHSEVCKKKINGKYELQF